jgi:hypothetical protein
MLRDDDMIQRMWEAANDELDESQLFEDNIEDLIAENTDSMDSVRDEYETLIWETEKTIEAADDKETLRLKQRELVAELEAKAATDDSLADELMRQRVILDTHKRLNGDEYEFKTHEEQIREAYENSDSWITDAMEERRQTEIDDKISGSWGREFIEGEWNNIDSDDAFNYASENGFIEELSGDEISGMDDEEIASLGWAPEDSRVTVKGDSDEVSIEIEGEGLDMERTLHPNEGYIKNDHFFLDEDSPYKGQGGLILAQQVLHAKSAGFDRIITDPARSDNMNGYYSWFTLGYDAPVSDLGRDLQTSVENTFPGAESIQDIFERPGGRDWWLVNGKSVHSAEFDLSNGSRSMRVLRDAMIARKKK